MKLNKSQIVFKTWNSRCSFICVKYFADVLWFILDLCFINGICYLPDQTEIGSECYACDANTSRDSWTFKDGLYILGDYRQANATIINKLNFTYMYFNKIIVLNKNDFCNSLDSIITNADPNFNQLHVYKESMTQKHMSWCWGMLWHICTSIFVFRGQYDSSQVNNKVQQW